MQIRAATEYESQTGSIRVRLYLVAEKSALVGGFSIRTSLGLSDGGAFAGTITYNNAGLWDVFDANSSAGSLSGIAASGKSLAVGADLLLAEIVFSASGTGGFVLACDGQGPDALFDTTGAPLTLSPGVFEIDPLPPILIATDPAEGSIVPVAGNLALQFSETVVAGAGMVELRTGPAGGTLVEQFDVTSSSRLTFAGDRLVVDPSAALLHGTRYFLRFAPGAIRDRNGNSYVSTGDAAFLTISASEGGTPADDVIIGTPAVDVLQGLAGNDTLVGLAGNDTLDGGVGVDTLTGGAGDDRYVVDTAQDVVTEAASEGTDSVVSSVSILTLPVNVEQLVYTGTGNFTGTGNVLVNVLTGGVSDDTLAGLEGNDTLSGLAGNDVLDGGLGSDRLLGGAGDDIYVVDAAGDVVSEGAAAGNDLVRTQLSALILSLNVEQLIYTGSGGFTGTGNALGNVLTGGAGDDTLVGLAGNDTLSGLAGNDVLDGGLGNDRLVGGIGDDVYTLDAGTDVVVEGLNAGTDVVRTALSVLALSLNVEQLIYTGSGGFTGTGNTLGNVLTGGAGDDTLAGLAGNDTLNGLAGVDTLSGGVGNDNYTVDDASDLVIEAVGAGTDVIRTSLAVLTLVDQVEQLVYTGTSSFAGTGNALANVMTGGISGDTLTGLAGNDTLRGGGGNDRLLGGPDSDSLDGGLGLDTADYSSEIRSLVCVLTGALPAPMLAAGVAEDSLQNVENLVGGDAADTFAGDVLSNQLNGGGGSDTLAGSDGADVLTGGQGGDHMTGGVGRDVFFFDGGDSGQTTAIDFIADFTKGPLGQGDSVDYSAALLRGGSLTAATSNRASVSNIGVATFAAGSGDTLADALSDIAASFTAAVDTAGEFALFKVGGAGNFHLFISDGSPGVSARDVVVELGLVTVVGSINLTAGNLTITA
jgi:Ca2+-binding RTX toxin-like protein